MHFVCIWRPQFMPFPALFFWLLIFSPNKKRAGQANFRSSFHLIHKIRFTLQVLCPLFKVLIFFWLNQCNSESQKPNIIRLEASLLSSFQYNQKYLTRQNFFVYLIFIKNLSVDFCEKEPLLRMPYTGRIILLAVESDTVLA